MVTRKNVGPNIPTTRRNTATHNVYRSTFGRALITEAARFNKGLPSDVIPYEVDNVELIGHAELLATLGSGASEALILKSPRTAET